MTTAARSPGTTAEHDRLAQATGRAEGDLFESNSWYEWGPISPNVPVAPYGRTTATTVMPGASFLMIMRAPGPTAGTKTAWPVGGISTGCPAMPGCAGDITIRRSLSVSVADRCERPTLSRRTRVRAHRYRSL
jgi:hypothetical protein